MGSLQEPFMTFNHAVVWIDHQQAHIIHFDTASSTVEVVRSTAKQPHLHHRSGTLGSGKAQTEPAYLHEVVQHVADAQEILVVGPGSAKLELLKHVHQHDSALNDRLVGVETVDHPSDGQLLAYAKKYFVKVDNMRGDII
jgi:stalled ribosome rescue protein Dom34